MTTLLPFMTSESLWKSCIHTNMKPLWNLWHGPNKINFYFLVVEHQTKWWSFGAKKRWKWRSNLKQDHRYAIWLSQRTQKSLFHVKDSHRIKLCYGIWMEPRLKFYMENTLLEFFTAVWALAENIWRLEQVTQSCWFGKCFLVRRERIVWLKSLILGEKRKSEKLIYFVSCIFKRFKKFKQ